MKIIKQKLNNQNLLKILEIDKNYYVNCVVPLSWYQARYNENNFGYFLVDKNDNTVGYLLIVGITKELYDAFKNKVLTGDVSINSNMFKHDSKYKYLASIVIEEEYRYKGYGKNLIEYALNEEEGSIISITVSPSGFKMINNYFNHVCSLNEDVNLFEFEIPKK